MNSHAVRKAVGRDTLFIHGSLTGGGGSMFKAAGAAQASPALLLGESNRSAEKCTPSCGNPATLATSAVCDSSCYTGGEAGARFAGHLCGAGNASEFGEHCRTCYNDLDEARAAEVLLAEEERVEVERRTVEYQLENGQEHDKRARALRVLKEGRDVETGRREEGLRGGGGGGGGEAGENQLGEAARRGLREAARGTKRAQGHGGDVGADDMMAARRRHVIMCDTLMPPPAASGCSIKCQKKDDTVSSNTYAVWRGL